ECSQTVLVFHRPSSAEVANRITTLLKAEGCLTSDTETDFAELWKMPTPRGTIRVVYNQAGTDLSLAVKDKIIQIIKHEKSIPNWDNVVVERSDKPTSLVRGQVQVWAF
ncbi:MAG: hypothetical protein HQL56_19800, partial [Magnetococcales bacterium]|nr:hypothetical protein [Magnetococcales bacterium]